MSFDELTTSEREIARMVARGMTNRQIAALRGVKAGTIHVQLGRICRKLGARNRTVLAVEYTRWKMRDPR